VGAVAGILSAWPEPFTAQGLDRYAALLETMAAFELPDEWDPTASRPDALRYVVLGTVLFEPLILALRRLAHVDRGAKLRARRTAAVAAPSRSAAEVAARAEAAMKPARAHRRSRPTPPSAGGRGDAPDEAQQPGG
jgi:hypothetical protein